jgi:hypothetical protein
VSATRIGASTRFSKTGNALIMPISLQHVTPQVSEHLAFESQQPPSSVAWPEQSSMAGIASNRPADSADATGAKATASAIKPAKMVR